MAQIALSPVLKAQIIPFQRVCVLVETSVAPQTGPDSTELKQHVAPRELPERLREDLKHTKNRPSVSLGDARKEI